jgi:hypothetical protein
MKRMTTLFVVVLFLACSNALGEDSNLEQQKYFNFWKPHAGQWTISIKEPGKEDITGTYNYEPSPTKLCYVGRGHDGSGTPILDGLYGYDSGRKCWVDVEIIRMGNSNLFSTVLLRADVDKELREGTTVSLDVTEAMDGKTLKYTATRVYKTLEKDRIVMVYQDRKTPERATLPDMTITVTRKK